MYEDRQRRTGALAGEAGEKTVAPYGGKKSPIIEYHNWQEALVAVSAHEFHHIHQFQNKLRCAERYCERAALEALERYRATLA